MRNLLSGHCRALILGIGMCWGASAAYGTPVDIALGSGRLGSSALGLFSFTLSANVGSNDSLILSTAGSSFDTEIALFDRHGLLVATNDDISPSNPLSELRFGSKKALPAGHYSVVLSGFNTIFRDGNIIPGSSQGGEFQLNLQSTQSVATPSLPAYTATDGHILPGSIHEIELGSGWLNAGTIQSFNFVLANDVQGGDWFAIHTNGTGFDSEIGLYDSEGRLVATNDDINSRNPLSRLSFGLDGDNGRRLLAGTYTLLLGGFNTIFRGNQIANSSSTWEGDYSIYLQSSQDIKTVNTNSTNQPLTVPEPSSTYLACTALILALGLKKVMPKRLKTQHKSPP